MTELAQRGAQNVVRVVTWRLATQVVLIASALIVPRLLGVADYGHFSAVMAVLAIAQSLSTLGMPLVEVRFLSPLWNERRLDAVLELAATILASRIGLSVAAGLVAAAWLMYSPQLALGVELCLALGALTAFRGGFESTRSLMLPIGRVGALGGFEFVRAVSTLAVVVAVFLWAGLEAVYIALPVLYAGLLVLGVAALLAVLPLRPSHVSWPSLRPHMGYGLLSYFGVLAGVAQSQFSVYAVAVFVTTAEAGLLALTMQAYLLLQTLYHSAQSALLPQLSQLASDGARGRLRYWGGVMMRYSTALATVACVGWAFVGRDVIDRLIDPGFGAVHRSATVILLGVAWFTAAAAANSLLQVLERPGLASSNLVVYAFVTMLGIWLALRGDTSGTHLRVAWAHTAAAFVYFLAAYGSLGTAERTWLPLRRTLLLILPIALAWPGLAWEASFPVRLGAAGGFALLYFGLAVALGLLPAKEMSAIVRLVTDGRAP